MNLIGKSNIENQKRWKDIKIVTALFEVLDVLWPETLLSGRDQVQSTQKMFQYLTAKLEKKRASEFERDIKVSRN